MRVAYNVFDGEELLLDSLRWAPRPAAHHRPRPRASRAQGDQFFHPHEVSNAHGNARTKLKWCVSTCAAPRCRNR